MNPLTTYLRSTGEEVLAKMYHGSPYAKTYVNPTQAQAAVDKLGFGWVVIQRGRPWYVKKV